MYQKVFFIFLIVLIASCKQSEKAKPGQGVITYKVSYPESNKYGMKAHLFPKQIILVFKDDKAAFIASAGLGMVQLVNLMDYKEKKFNSLLIDELRGNFACTFTQDEIKQNEESVQLEFSKTNKTKTIAGLLCKQAMVKDITNQTSFEVFYYDKIKFNYWNSPFKDFKYLLTEYTHTINGLTMKLEATNIDLTTPVDTTLFNVKGTYTRVNQQNFFSRLSQL
jgi:hypothetical protein